MANITKVPNGPLVKKTGKFKGSTLKAGGVIKKAQDGTTTPSGKTWFQMSPSERKNKQVEIKTKRGREGFNKYMDSVANSNFEKNAATRKMSVEQLRKDNKKPDVKVDYIGPSSSKGGAKSPCKGGICPGLNTKSRNGSILKKAQTGGTYYASSKGRVGRLSGSKIGDDISAVQNESIDTTGYAKGKKDFTKTINKTYEKPTAQKVKRADVLKVISNLKKGATQKMDFRTSNQRKKSNMKAGGMIKRADGSFSKPGLWDNIRKNKGSGKKPTKAMLVQEKKIKAKTKK